MAGLVANNFIRVEHGVTTRSGSTSGSCGSASNISGQTLSNVAIDAAILALNHSFIVDNYDCGEHDLGNADRQRRHRAALPRHRRNDERRHRSARDT